MFYWSVWTWSIQCPWTVLCIFPPVSLRVLLLAGSAPRKLHFPLGFPWSTALGRWMFASFRTLARTRGCTWDAPIPPSLLLEERVVALTQILLAKGGAAGESWAVPQAGAHETVKGDGEALLLNTPPSWNHCIINGRQQTLLLATGSALTVQPSSITGPSTDPTNSKLLTLATRWALT